MSKDYFSKLAVPERKRYTEKLKSVGLSHCPFSLPSFLWSYHPTEWQEVTYFDIYNYLIESSGIKSI